MKGTVEYQNKTITLKGGRTALLRAVCKEDAIPMIAYMKACYEPVSYTHLSGKAENCQM